HVSLAGRTASPTPLPYTTLFRSRRRPAVLVGDDGGEHATRRQPGRADPGQRRVEVPVRPAGVPLRVLDDVRARVVEYTQRTSSRDRKSTRLNSSHVKISYAVFCL